MERGELDFALGLAAAEGWNPGLNDAEAFWQADPQGYFIGLQDGKPAATISAVAYGDEGASPSFGFIGLYIVVPGLRGRGLGYRLWDAALGALTAPTIGLDAVLAQQDTYRKDGFELAYQSCRFEGRNDPKPGSALPAGLLPLADFPLDEVLAYAKKNSSGVQPFRISDADLDHDGKLTPEEQRKAGIKGLEQHGTVDLREMDLGGDGYISKEDLDEYFRRKHREAYARADADKDGAVRPSEFALFRF